MPMCVSNVSKEINKSFERKTRISFSLLLSSCLKGTIVNRGSLEKKTFAVPLKIQHFSVSINIGLMTAHIEKDVYC